MPTALAINQLVAGALADPTGTTGIAAGHKFANDGKVFLRIVNGASNANAVINLVPAGTVTAGSYILAFLMSVGGSTPTLYTTAAILATASPSTIATAVLAATQPNGNALSADFPSGTVTGSGSAVNAGTAILTFAGGFAHTPIPAPVVNAASITGGGTVDGQVGTAGAGSGVVSFPEPPVGGNAGVLNVVLAPGTSWIGAAAILPALYNQVGTATDGGFTYINYDTPANYTVTVFHS